MNTLKLLRLNGTPAFAAVDSPRRAIADAILVFLAYYAGARLGLALTLPPQPISVLWPPNALMMGFLLVTPIHRWPILLLAALPAHYLAELQQGVPLKMVTCWFISNMTEALIGAYCLRRLLNGAPTFGDLRSVGLFIACAVIAAPFFSSFIDVTFVVLTGWSQEGYSQLWSTRFFSNALANLTIVPFVATAYAVATAPWNVLAKNRLIEALVLLFSLIAVNFVVFDSRLATPAALPALLYLPVPFLLWATLRFGLAGSSTAFMIVVLIVIWGVSHDRGPFASALAAQTTLPVQLFLIFVGTTLLALTGAIEERRSALQKLRGSERRFAVAFRANPEAIAISRVANGKLIDVNDRWLQMFEYEREQVIGRSVRELGVYSEGSVAGGSLDPGEQYGAVREQELNVTTSGGDVVRAVVSRDVVDLDGSSCFITIVRDVTDLKRAIHSLRINDERTRLVLKATNDVIYDWNIALDRLWWNENGEAYFGKWTEDYPHALARWSDLLHPEDKDRVMRESSELLEGSGERSDSEYRLRRTDGSYGYVHGRSLLLRNALGRPLRMIGSLTDITDRKRAEEANLRLVHVSRLMVLGELTASIAHEINQPLGAILSNADSAEILLNQKEIPVEELRQVISEIRQDDIRAGQVIRHIRDLLKKRELTMQPLDLNRAIGDVLGIVNADLRRHSIAVETSLDPLPAVFGDQVHVQQVVLNLIFNAVDAMAHVPESQRRLWVQTTRYKTEEVEVSIADTGVGIPADKAEHLFESFFTTKDNGTGLGLSIARSIVEAHGGTIRAEARKECGSVFRFTLPNRPRAQTPAPAKESTATEYRS